MGVLFFTTDAGAANAFFDVNGPATAYGTATGGSYAWDDPNWATVTGGGNATAFFVPGSFAEFLGAGNYTVTVTNSESIAGLVENSSSGAGSFVTINATGGGSLNIVSNTTLTLGFFPVQGFFAATGGQICIINAPITGTGGINQGSFNGTTGSPQISLFGNNTYSGGTVLNSSGVFVNFNNNNSFGTGPIIVNNTTAFVPLLGHGGSTITLPNNFTNFTGTCTVNFAADANTPVILNGSWAMQTFAFSLRNNGNSTSPLTLNGALTGSGALTLSGNNAGKITFAGANSYTSKTLIAGGANVAGVGITLSVGSLNKVSGGSPTSNLGAPTTVANGTIGIGLTTFNNTLLYTGPGETSDRVIDLAGTTGGATLQADGTGALVLTAANTATGVGAKTLTLQGANTSTNSIGKIVNSSSGATSVTKAQAGSWILTGANTYSGVTTVNAGNLLVSGSVAGSCNIGAGTLEVAAAGSVGNVTNTATGTLKLNSTTGLRASAVVTLSSSLPNSAVNLNFSGTNSIDGLVIDGTPAGDGDTWGSSSSPAQHTSAIFTGTGVLQVVLKPVITQAPQSLSVYPDTQNVTFSVAAVGDPNFTYQWKFNNGDILGANASTYTIPHPAETADAGNYTCAVTNGFGGTISPPGVLTILPTNAYVNAVLANGAIAYWRLDESSGTVAHDSLGWLGTNNGTYVNTTLNQPGYSVTDTNPAISLPTDASTRGYVQVDNFGAFKFNASSTYTLEGWVRSTNFTSKQRLFSTLSLANPGGYAFGILPGGTALEFTAGAVRDNDTPTLVTPLVAGTWYHLVLTCDGNYYAFYVNGLVITNNMPIGGGAPQGVAVPLVMGCNPPAYVIGTGDHGAEQVKGSLDEMAIYGTALDATTVTNHYLARYGTLAPPIVSAPTANPPTNYVSLSAKLQANAAGQALSYQWYTGVAPGGTALSDGGNISGSTSDTLTISPLSLADGTNYWVQVSNPAGTSNSPSTSLIVLPIPTSPSQLNVTNGLVLHLPFEGDYLDISGHNNHGTNVGVTTFVSPSSPPAAVGTNALHYSSDSGSSSYNYVTLGTRSDLKFGTSTDFTVSYWVRQTANSTFTNLPFFTDVIGSTTAAALGGNPGFAFAPYATSASSGGGWQLALGSSGSSMSSPSQFTSFPDVNLINDGNWHHLVHVATRVASVETYLDGIKVDSEADSLLGNMDNNKAATIGQDPSGAYPVTADADIDDVGLWRRALTPLEISGIYLAGVSNSVSFAPPVAAAIVPVALQVQQVSPGQWQLVWSGTSGALQAAGIVNGTYTNVPGATSPYPLPTGSAPQLFYRLKY